VALAAVVSLGVLQAQHDTVSDVFDIGHIERDQFGPPQGGGEPDQQDAAIPEVFEAAAHSVEHQEEVVAEQRFCLQRSAPSVPFYASQRCPDEF
jgi:hypothetical protein